MKSQVVDAHKDLVALLGITAKKAKPLPNANPKPLPNPNPKPNPDPNPNPYPNPNPNPDPKNPMVMDVPCIGHGRLHKRWSAVYCILR
jgi:hypothetical protein